MEVKDLLELYVYDDAEIFIFDRNDEQIFSGVITNVPRDIEERVVTNFCFNEFCEFVINVI